MDKITSPTIQKVIFDDFIEKEEENIIKSMEASEAIVIETKKVIENLMEYNYDYEMIKELLANLNKMLTKECNDLESSYNAFSATKEELSNKISEQQKKIEKKAENFLTKSENLKLLEEMKDLKISIIENNYNKISNIIKNNLNNKESCVQNLEMFYAENEILKNKVLKKKNEKEKLLNEYKSLLRENLNFKAKNEQYEIKKISDFLDEISAEGKIKDGKYKKGKIKELETNYYNIVNQYNTLAEKIMNVVATLDGLNIVNPRLTKELEVINKVLYPCEKRLNRSFTQMYENHDWDDIDEYIDKQKAVQNRKKYKNNLIKFKGTKSTIIP